MARRFVAHQILHGRVDDDIVAYVDRYMRRSDPGIPVDAVMVWDPVVRVIRWEWDDGEPAWKPSCGKCDSGFPEHRCHMEEDR
jgi:hypothetical protein